MAVDIETWRQAHQKPVGNVDLDSWRKAHQPKGTIAERLGLPFAEPVKKGLTKFIEGGGLKRELESLGGFATFPYTLTKEVIYPMAKGAITAPFRKEKAVKEIQEAGGKAEAMGKDLAGGIRDWLIGFNPIRQIWGSEESTLARQRIANRVKERGVVAESVYPMALAGAVKGGTGLVKGGMKALKGERIAPILEERLAPTLEKPSPIVAGEIPLREEPSIGKLQNEQTGLLQKIMDEAKKKEIVSHETISPTGGIAPVIGMGETKVRGLAKHIDEKAIESGLTKGFEGLPEYDVLNMKEQATKTADFISKDYELAKRIAMGHEQPPADIHSSAFLVGVEQSALKTGDVVTIRDLALNSKLMEQATSAGQWIRTLGERNPESPIGAIKEIAKAREQTVRVRVKNIDQIKQREVEGIKTQIKKASLSNQTWEQFIESIRCK